ncbi:Transcription termination factor like [Melia azedarach]|uniref:Transcription termination factor like n=1 Tax=Melia azedarach TaxID=155640 RepID=A0ACC1Z1C7_MELAZ|nr:Transcription termination factor like [Melia azedarach]
MLRSICKTLIPQQRSIEFQISDVRYVQTLPFLNSISKSRDQQSLTVSYLTNSCGLSLEKAISASKVINIERTEKPNSVIQLLTSHGFTKFHIATLVSKHPPILLAHPEKNLKPKFEYFKSVGILGPDLPKFLCSNKHILLCSLNNQIMPTFDFLRRFVQTNENLVYALKQSTRVIGCNIEKKVKPNINTLRAHGVPELHIAKLIMLQPSSLILSAAMFKNVVDVIKEMGFEPTSRLFLLAVRSMSVISKSAWLNKKNILMSFGWSESEFNLAFRKQPMMMLSSGKKIRKLMDFYVNEVGLKPSDIVKCPNLLLVGLEKRIIPRWSVLKVLMSKNLLKKDADIIWALNTMKLDFEKRYITCYMDDPEVTRAYQGVLGSQTSVK